MDVFNPTYDESDTITVPCENVFLSIGQSIEWGVGKKHWFKAFPFAIVAINILIAVASDFESAITGWNKWWLDYEQS